MGFEWFLKMSTSEKLLVMQYFIVPAIVWIFHKFISNSRRIVNEVVTNNVNRSLTDTTKLINDNFNSLNLRIGTHEVATSKVFTRLDSQDVQLYNQAAQIEILTKAIYEINERLKKVG